MGIIRFAIENPVKVTVAVILMVLFGILSIFRIPIQLTPDVDRPLVTVNTFWEGASPQEIEREIVDRQEEKLKGVRNLKKMTSTSREAMAEITLEFYVGTDKDVALRDVSEKLRQVTGYPEEVDEPTIQATGAEMSATIAWIIFRGRPGEDVSNLKDLVEDDIKPILERAEDIARVDVYGGREREVQVVADAYKLAARKLSFRDLEQALRGHNDNISAGTISQGKRDFTYRTVGQYEQVEDVENTVVAYRDGGPVFVRDVAQVHNTFKRQYAFVKSSGDYVLALPARKETGANVMKAMAALKKQIDYCNKTILHPQGRGLTLTQVYDETTYIKSAIRLVRNNLLVGGTLAVIVLLVFLRSLSATGIVAFSIPISVISTFLAIAALGRNLNVVMLAGLAFAVGMVVDNAIVVLENIYRHRQLGKGAAEAALDGTREVWGAVLASTLTTMAVFLPVVFIEEEAGQLFRDIAIAIVCAVGLSLAVATTVIPTLASRTLRISRKLREAESHTGHTAALVGRIVAGMNRSWIARLALIAILVVLSVVGSAKLMPPTDYLPSGNRNLVFGFLNTPPGYSLDTFRKIAHAIEDGTAEDPHGLREYWDAQVGSPEEAALPPVMMQVQKDGETVAVQVPAPPIDSLFFVSWGGGCFMGATSKYEQRVKPLANVMAGAGGRVPGVMSFFFQASLFAGASGGNAVELDIRGDELDEVIATAGMLIQPIMERFGFPRPEPANFALGRPEVRIVTNREKAADLGLDVRDIGFIVAACVDGAFVGNFYDKGDEIDLKIHVKDTEGFTVQQVGQIPIYTPSERVVPLASAVNFVTTTAPQQINHIEEMPAVSLEVRPPEGMALETAMSILEDEIIAPMRAAGAIPPSVVTALAGTADKLVQTREALFGSWKGNSLAVDPDTGQRPLLISLANLFTSRGFLALLVTYLLMAALFESFLWPFVIIFTVPLATVGGFASLRIVHQWSLQNPVSPIQQLDVLTMLGFVILIGIVVNNGILVVHQALNNQRDYRMPWPEAIAESVRTRVRPIFMTAFTSIGGMLPLVLWPGAGSELYRGLGSVVIGGLLVSTLFTLFLVPAVLSVVVELREALARAFRRSTAPTVIGAPAPPKQPAAAGTTTRA
ncbi:MAG TPA: efflux RND transporter permease subunit [Phycisphaerae bacterium]|nr:efflux RND transporter permease subunit [Phycisphaerae bacterium]